MGNIHTAAHFKTKKMNKLRLHATKRTVTHFIKPRKTGVRENPGLQFYSP